jgi:hypothetical protein
MAKRQEQQASTSAKVLYRPVGLVTGTIAAVIAGQIFAQVWKRVSAGEGADPPGPLETEYPLKEILLASAIQGAIFAVVRTIVNRGGARAFERATGEWPGG